MQAAKLRVPSVVDAGALAYVEEFGPMTVLTPHHGELASLCQRLGLVESLTDEDKATAVATMLSMTVLVKGSITAVVDPTGAVLRLPPATPWLATAGTGDVLAGILGALFAGSHATLTEHPELLPHAVYAGALLHQEAARRASDRLAGAGGTPGAPITASDVCEELPGLIAEVLR
jgi:NAD(P)H-hydrate repair Nnr-like enzyme with NAD(P)H-hydrate dehydratase domain